MQESVSQYEDLSGFERLDLGELYFLASRHSIERGLAYYRSYHVESLEWCGDTRTLVASVSGSRPDPYTVSLRLRGGKIQHQCDCAEWNAADGCKHVVAAMAAVFLAVQGKSAGDYDMPEDYAQELRQGLGYRDVGGEDGETDGLHAFSVGAASEVVLTKIGYCGTLHFQVAGDMPHTFLRAAGVSLPNGAYGYSNSRDFSLEAPEVALAEFLECAESHQIPVLIEMDGVAHALRVDNAPCRERIVFAWTNDSVAKRHQFLSQDGALLDVYQRIDETPLVILQDGRVLQCDNEIEGSLNETVGFFAEPRSEAVIAAAGFNEGTPLFYEEATLNNPEDVAFRVDGKPATLRMLPAEETTLQLKLDGVVNAADELEGLRFGLYLKGSNATISLNAIGRDFVEPLLEAGGTLLGAKYRVRALFDLIRRMLSADSEADAGPALSKRPLPKQDFPDLLNQRYGYSAQTAVHSVLRLVEGFGTDKCCVAVDRTNRQWLSVPMDARKIGMLLFSLVDATSREDVGQLHAGMVPVPRGLDSAKALQRIMTVCRALGVEMVFNESEVRTAKVSIDFRGMNGGTGIDWFELHPSIRCGEYTLSGKEWKQLVQGELLLKGADGAWLMPEFDDADTDGIRMLSGWLERQTRKKHGDPGDAHMQISRLEMLDWIALRKRGMKLTLPTEAEEVFESLTRFNALGRFTSPPGFKAKLREYQNEGCAWIDFLYQHRFGACLADDMGLGKTVQTIGFLFKYLQDRKRAAAVGTSVLIVLPPSLVFNWFDEFERFAPDIKVMEANSRRAFRAALGKAEVLLTTYDRVRMDVDTFREHAFDIVVFDEAHNLKNVSAARTKAAAKLRRRFTLCLTGTPVENNVSEFFSVMSTAVPGIFGSIRDFKEAFKEDPDRLLARARPFILRRKKEKILKELPPKEEHELFLEMSPMQKEIYARTVAEVKAEIAHAYEGRPEQQAGIVALAAILRLRQVCVSPEILGKPLKEPAPKFAYMAEKLEELRSEGHAALVFSQFHGGLNEMEKVAAECGFDYLRMDGKTPVSRRKQIVADFQAGDGPPFFFISLKTGGVGLNLTRANYVFHLDPWWNPAVENQASDRAHRIGQTRSVFVQRLIMRHTIEERMLELKAHKAKLFRQLIDEPGGHSTGAGLSRSDFDFLISG